ncbi:hypothetical protein QUA71_26065 [Microcoleus sp. MON1_C5]|uniref:hypothetical protein n=1 Tax=Microcoleus sp. MON1_C5 TaxID=2818828 RepID=UPI002FD15E61
MNNSDPGMQYLDDAIALLIKLKESLKESSDKQLLPQDKTKLTRGDSIKNDPLEFYINCCAVKPGNEIPVIDLFFEYKKWCFKNGSLTRGRRPFVDALISLGAPDGIVGVMRGKTYTLRNITFKPD